MKKYLLTIFGLLFFSVSFAQNLTVTIDDPLPVCNVGDCVKLNANYIETKSTNGYVVTPLTYAPFFSFTGGTVLPNTSGDDNWSNPPYALPFKFCFYGQNYNQVLVGSNGLIHFPDGSQPNPNDCEWNFGGITSILTNGPNAAFPIKNAVYGVYQDTNIESPPVLNSAIQNVNYYETGIAPNRAFIANFNQLPLFGGDCASSGNQTSQIILYEGTNVIEVLISRRNINPGCTWNTPDGAGVVGLMNSSGSNAVIPTTRNIGSWSTTNEAWRFTPDQAGPSNTQLTWLANGVSIPATTDVNPITVCPTVATTYTAVVKYTQCDNSVITIQDTQTVGPEAPLPVLNPKNRTVCGTPPGPFIFNINQNAHMLNGAPSIDYVFIYHIGSATGPIIPFTNLATYSSAGAGELIFVEIIEQNNAGCNNFRSFSLNAVPTPSGTFTYASPSYCDNVTAAQPTVPVTLTPGGTYTATPPGLIINTTTGAITPAGSTPNTYTVNYDVPISATCPAYNTSTTVEIKPVLTPTVNCGTSSTSSVEFTWPAVVGATGYTVSYQIGASPVVNIGSIGNLLTYTVNSLSPGNTVVITVTPTGGSGTCFAADTQSCVAISCTPPTATITYATPFCNSNTALQSPTLTGIGLFTGGTYSIAPTPATTPTAITINATTGQITPSASLTGGSYVVTYSIPAAVVGCPVVTATTTIVINNQPNAGADGATTTCDSSTIAVNLATLITGEQAGGVWTRTGGSGGTFDAVAGTYTPAIGCNNSTFAYTITGTTPCIDDASVATVNINPAPTVSSIVATNTSVCPNTATSITFTGTPGATVTYTINGGTNQTIPLNPVTGIAVLPTGNLAVATTYALVSVANTVTTCSQTQVGTAVVNMSPNSTIVFTNSLSGNTNQSACAGDLIFPNIDFTIGSGATGASVTGLPVGLTGTLSGTSYTIGGVPPFAVGTYNYTINTTGGCGMASITGTITVKPLSTMVLTSAAATTSQVFCINTGIPNSIVYTAGAGVTNMNTAVALPAGMVGAYNAIANTFTIGGTPTVAGAFNYTVTTSGGCAPNVSLSGTITVTPLPTITLTSAPTTASQTICSNNATQLSNIQYTIGGTATGASITTGALPTGVTGTFAGGVFTIVGTPNVPLGGVFNYTISSSGGCNPTATISGTITVKPLSAIDLTSAAATTSQTFCINTGIPTPIVYTAGAGVTNMNTVVALPAGLVGTYNANTFTIGGTPTVAGVFNYTVITSGGCAPDVSLSGTITVTPLPTITLTSAAATSSQTICSNNVTPLSNIQYTITNATSASITSGPLPAGVVGNFAGGVFTISGTPTVPLGGVFNYTVTTSGGCAPPATTSGSITVSPLPTMTLTSGSAATVLCANVGMTPIVYTAGVGVTNIAIAGALPAGITGLYNAAAKTYTISGTPTGSGVFPYTVTTNGVCAPNITLTGNITVNTLSAITLTSAPTTASQTLCASTPLTNITYAVGSGVTGASITTGALPANVTGIFAAGVFTISGIPTLPVGSTAQVTYNYTVTTSGGCAPDVSLSGSIVVNPVSVIALQSGGTAQTLCANTPMSSIVYNTGAGVTNVNFVLTPVILPLLGVTGVFNATTGQFTISGTPSSLPLPTVNTTYTYTLTTVGVCAPGAIATGTITITPGPSIALSATAPVANIAQTVCNGSAINNIVYEIGGTATGASATGLPTGVSGSYTAGAAGLPGLFTITGTPNITASGVFNYTVTTTGGCTTGGGVALSGKITVTKKPIPTVQGGTICLDLAGNPNGTFTIQAKLDGQIDDTNHTYIWFNNTTGTPVVIAGQTASVYTATSPGTYTVQAVPNLNTLCLSDIVSVVVSPVVPPASAVTVTSDYFSDLQTVTVTVTPAGNYEYQIDNGVFQSSNVFQGVGSRAHDIVVRNECGVVTTTSYIVDFPKVFTPNGDGLNDTWNISELSTQPKAKIYIFDRFGKLVKEISPAGAGWNGTFNTQELPATDYWFTLSYEEKGIMKELKSHFALKR